MITGSVLAVLLKDMKGFKVAYHFDCRMQKNYMELYIFLGLFHLKF